MIERVEERKKKKCYMYYIFSLFEKNIYNKI